ncbi:hypothetical protein GCM10027592_26180 [Spirosoma flavus]
MNELAQEESKHLKPEHPLSPAGLTSLIISALKLVLSEYGTFQKLADLSEES